jgi:hypothetical protein
MNFCDISDKDFAIEDALHTFDTFFVAALDQKFLKSCHGLCPEPPSSVTLWTSSFASVQ